MKKVYTILIALAMVLVFAACSSKPTLVGEMADDGKSMEITANKADIGDFMMSGSLEVAEGEQVAYENQMEKGALEIQLIPGAENQNIEELPELDGEAAKTLELSGTESGSADLAPGSYMVKVTVTGDEKAKGMATLKAEAAGE